MRTCFYCLASSAVTTLMMIQGTTASSIMFDDIAEGIVDEKMQQQTNNCRKWQCEDHENEVVAPKWPLELVSYGCQNMNDSFAYASDLFQQCCHTKSACYQTCGTVKNLCDKQFMACGQRICEKRSDTKQKEECTTMLNMQLLPTLKKGKCREFYAEQESHCECVAREEATEKRTAVIKKFLEKHNPEALQQASAWVKRADEPAKMATLLMKLVGKHKDEIKVILDSENHEEDAEKSDAATASSAEL